MYYFVDFVYRIGVGDIEYAGCIAARSAGDAVNDYIISIKYKY